MEMDHVGLTKLWQTSDIGTSVGDVDLEEMTTGKEQSTVDDKTFPEKMPIEQWRIGQGNDRERIAEFVAYQHLRLDSMVVESHHQTVGSNGSTSRTVTGIDNEHPHD